MAAAKDRSENIAMQTAVDMSVDAPDRSGFGMTVMELRELMEFRGGEAVQIITTKYAGATNICRKLLTDENSGKSI